MMGALVGASLGFGRKSIAVLLVLGSTPVMAAHSQSLSLGAGTGPVFLPGSGASADWQALLWLGIGKRRVGGRLEAMYTGVPGADLVAFTGNLVWTFRPGQKTGFDPYVVAGLGSYVKFSESRFGLNGGAGVGRRVGSVRLFAEVRYHRVTERFEEANEANTFVPVLLGITLGR
jgi:hypothetical protein